MDKQTSPVAVEFLTRASAQDIDAIQKLLAQLSDNFQNLTLSREFIDEIIHSSYHEILLARDTSSGTIIGCATLSITFGAGAGRRVWLDDFIIDSNHQGKGIGGLLWKEAIEWAKRHDANTIQFTSSDKHKQAHSFYLKRGAIIRDTNFFKKSID